ncbi:MAG: DUF1207 domain-containing protein [Elusimicrobia bacterium]|nr:DUF1207 domain-containing protein [Elusimicrobiota bacterium]
MKLSIATALFALALLCQAQRCLAGDFFEAPAPPLMYSDRQQPMLRLQRVWGIKGETGKGNFYDTAVAMPLPLYNTLNGDNGWFFNAVAGISARFGINIPDDLYASDFTGGISAVRRSPSGDLELFLYRRSSHLGDSAIYNGYGYAQRSFSRDTLRLLYFSNQEGAFPGAVGGSYILDKTPGSPSGRLGFQYSMEIPVSRRMFMGATLAMSQEYAWALDSNFQAGFRLGRDKDNNRRPALVLEYHSGASPYGQFYAGKERTLSLGFVGAL